MKPEDTSLDAFFQQKDEVFMPDVSGMAKHWQALKITYAAQVLEAFYEELDKPAQVFTIEADREEVVVGKEGTRLRIPAYCFGDVAGKVEIHLQEYYSYADMVAGRLGTSSGDRQLASGGMLHVKAMANGVELPIAEDKRILVNMPAAKYDEEMILFAGVVADENLAGRARMDWVPVSQEEAQQAKVKEVGSAATMPLPAYGKQHLTSLTVRTIKEHLRAVNQVKQSMKKGQESGNSGGELPEDADGAQASQPPGHLHGYDLSYVTMEHAQKWLNSFVTVKKVPRQVYRFTTNTLGWLNCDRYLEPKGDLISITVQLDEILDAPVILPQLAYTNYPSIVYGEVAGNRIRFENVPAHEPVELILTGVKDGQVVYCIQKIQPNEAIIHDLSFMPATAEQYRQQLAAHFSLLL